MNPKEAGFPHQNIITLLKALSSYRIPYVIVGGAALALHGIPRSTLDVDIVIPTQTETVIKIFKAAKHANLKSNQTNILSLAEKPELITGQWVTFEDKNKRQLIDVFLEKESLFKELYRKSIKRRSHRLTFCVASLDDLEKMKKATGRAIDLADVALIQELREIQKLKKTKGVR